MFLQFVLFLLLSLDLLALSVGTLPLGLAQAVLVGLALQRPLAAEVVLQRGLRLPLEVPLLYVLLVLFQQCVALQEVGKINTGSFIRSETTICCHRFLTSAAGIQLLEEKTFINCYGHGTLYPLSFAQLCYLCKQKFVSDLIIRWSTGFLNGNGIIPNAD